MSTRRLAKVPLFGNAAKAVTVEAGATVGAQIGVNLLMPDGSPATTAKLQALFGDGTPSDGSINTTDDLEEGQWNLWFTPRRAQDAVGSILADTATIDLAYTAGTSITATLKDLADSGTGAALVKITRDAKGRISGTSAATTTDLAEGTNLYFTDARADARITLQKAQPLGLATLDAAGKLDAGQLPALAITETFVVNTEAAMLALSAQEGDVAVRTDLSKSFILTAAPASTLANWQELLTPTGGVSSFNGRTGSVTPASGDYTPAQVGAEPAITASTATQYWRGDKTWQALDKAAVGLGNVDNTSDVNKPVSAAQAEADAMNVPLDGSRPMTGTLKVSGNVAAPGMLPGLFGTYIAGQDNVPTFSQLDGFGSSTGMLFRAATGSAAAPTALPADALIGQFQARGHDGVSYSANETVAIWFESDGAWSGSSHPGRISMFTTPAGATSQLLRFRIWKDGEVTAGADNSQTLGSPTIRWSVVYAGTGAINTSDAREKTDVVALTAAELAAAADLSRAIGTYQWLESVQLKGAGARYHAGLTVQQAIAIMQAHGLDPFRYGFICYDQWPETPEVVSSWPARDAVLDDDGNVITPAVEAGSEVTQAYRPAGDRYSFRTDELLLFIARGFAARLDALETAR